MIDEGECRLYINLFRGRRLVKGMVQLEGIMRQVLGDPIDSVFGRMDRHLRRKDRHGIMVQLGTFLGTHGAFSYGNANVAFRKGSHHHCRRRRTRAGGRLDSTVVFLPFLLPPSFDHPNKIDISRIALGQIFGVEDTPGLLLNQHGLATFLPLLFHVGNAFACGVHFASGASASDATAATDVGSRQRLSFP